MVDFTGRIDRQDSANNVIWHDILKEFESFVGTVVFDYNDIIDVVKHVRNIQQVPHDNNKYYVKFNENSNLYEKIISYDEDGVLVYEYTPQYKDRIIFMDSEFNTNYIFMDLEIDPEKDSIIVQREEGDKWNNTFLGNYGITILESKNEQMITLAPSFTFLIKDENNIPMWNRYNQPKEINKSCYM